MQGAARDEPAGETLEFVTLDRGEALVRAVRRQAIGVAGKDARAPGAARHRRRIVRLVPQLRVHLLAHALERRLVEARRVEAKAQQLAGAVEMAREGAHPPADMVALAMEGDFDRLLVERLLEGLVVEIARAFVEQAGQQGRGARLARRVLRRAAAKGEFERHQGNRIVLDQPKANAARRDEFAHIDRALGVRIDEGYVHERFLDLALPLTMSASSECSAAA